MTKPSFAEWYASLSEEDFEAIARAAFAQQDEMMRRASEPGARIREFNMSAHEGQPIEATGIMEGPAIKQFAIACVDWFKKEGGQSFVTCDLTHPDGDAYQITMQKAGGKTPAQRIRELEAELAAHKSSGSPDDWVMSVAGVLVTLDEWQPGAVRRRDYNETLRFDEHRAP